MGSGAGGYLTIQLTTDDSKYDPAEGTLYRVSELTFQPAPSPVGRTVPPGMASAPKPPPLPLGKPKPTPAGKVGLGGLKPEDVVTFNLYARMDDDSLVGMGTVADSAIRHEAEDVFGGDWAGFAVTAAPSGGRFRLVAELKFKPNWRKKAKRPFQVIPVVMAFGTDLFEDHYLISLVVAQETDERVDTTVTQPYQ